MSLAERGTEAMSEPFHVAFKYIIPVLYSVLAISVQSGNMSPFETHSAYMYTSIFATFIYYFAFVANDGSVALIFGGLASISMVSIVVPCRWVQYIFFITWIVGIIIKSYQQAAIIKETIVGFTTRLTMFVIGIGEKIWDKASIYMEQRLPV